MDIGEPRGSTAKILTLRHSISKWLTDTTWRRHCDLSNHYRKVARKASAIQVIGYKIALVECHANDKADVCPFERRLSEDQGENVALFGHGFKGRSTALLDMLGRTDMCSSQATKCNHSTKVYPCIATHVE